jgi:hypothetical protein
LQLTHHPPRHVGGQVGQVLQKLLYGLAHDAPAEVVTQEAVVVRGDLAAGDAPG